MKRIVIRESLQVLRDAGAEVQQEIRDVGGDKLTASMKDAISNVIALMELL